MQLELQMGAQAQRLNDALSRNSEMEGTLAETKTLFVARKMEVQTELSSTKDALAVS